MDKRIAVNGNDTETEDRLSNLGDVLGTQWKYRKTLTARIKSAWKRCKDVFCILCKKDMSLRIKTILYRSYVRSTLSYGYEY